MANWLQEGSHACVLPRASSLWRHGFSLSLFGDNMHVVTICM